MLADFEEIKRKVDSGEVKFYGIEKYLMEQSESRGVTHEELSQNWEKACNKAAEYRRKVVGAGEEFSTEGSFFNLAPPNVRIENSIGTKKIKVYKIPEVPVVGTPTIFQGEQEHVNGSYQPLLAVSENPLKALVYGSKVLRESNKKIESIVTKDGIARSILIKTNGLTEAYSLNGWIHLHSKEIEKIVYNSDKWHNCTLSDINIWQSGSRLYIRLVANTGDAMGMNMLTQASDDVGCWIQEKAPERFRAHFETVSANMCTDKKPAAIDHILGRGKTVSSRAILTDEDLKPYGASSRQLFNHIQWEDWANKDKPASKRNVHALDIISGFFVHGQDLAQTVESSNCQKYVNLVDEHIIEYTIELPSLEIATFGGGSTTPSAQKFLDVIGCRGGGKAIKLAEIIAATVLQAELGRDIYEIRGYDKLELAAEFSSDISEIPVGVAGPINGRYILLGTTETALIGAVNAGIKAIEKNKENFKIEINLVGENEDDSKVFDVYTEIRIPSSYFEKDPRHRASSLAMVNLLREKCWDGSGKAGGYFGSENTNIANSVAALNVAYNQPLSLIRQNSQGSIMGELAYNGDLVFSLNLPVLELRNCGELKAEELAEIYAAAVTGLELRTTWTQAAGTLARAHTGMTKG